MLVALIAGIIIIFGSSVYIAWIIISSKKKK
jgi:hypothetical protein